jgi:hypothetical protein
MFCRPRATTGPRYPYEMLRLAQTTRVPPVLALAPPYTNAADAGPQSAAVSMARLSGQPSSRNLASRPRVDAQRIAHRYRWYAVLAPHCRTDAQRLAYRPWQAGLDFGAISNANCRPPRLTGLLRVAQDRCAGSRASICHRRQRSRCTRKGAPLLDFPLKQLL